MKSLLFCTLILVLTISISQSKPVHHKGYFKTSKVPYRITAQSLDSAKDLPENQGASRTNALLYTNSNFTKSNCESFGVEVLNTFNTTAYVSCYPAQLPYLKAINGVEHVGRPVPIIPMMDSSRILCAIDQAHRAVAPNYPQGPYTGKNVLIGILDTEFDTRHPAFLDSNNQTRFVAIWDQADSSGKHLNKYGFGTIKNHTQLLVDTVFGSQGHFHGTLTAGAATGSDRKSGFHGAAPDAMIVGVCYDMDNSLSIINGLQWISSLADSLQVPSVINMSIGLASGPHDGTSEIDKVVDELSGPGRIVVGAAGNDGVSQSHVLFDLERNQTTGTFVTPTTTTKGDTTNVYWAIDLWGVRQQHFKVSTLFYNVTTGEMIEDSSPFSTIQSNYYKPDTVIWNNDTIYLNMISERSSALNNKPHAHVYGQCTNPDIYLGIKVTPTTTATTIHAWNSYKKSFKSFDIASYINGDNNYSINEVGGTAKKIIAVGSYMGRISITNWDGTFHAAGESDTVLALAGFSGRGPTVDGRIKPDITAPGHRVVSAMSNYADDYNFTIYWPFASRPYGRYSSATGTSISAPIVAGTIALLLQADPTLTPEDIRETLQTTAIKDNITGTLLTPDNNWGAGRLNAFGALRSVLGISPTLSHNKPINTPLFRMYKDNFTISNFDTQIDLIRIVDLRGRVINQYRALVNGSIPKPSVAGIYTVIYYSGKTGTSLQEMLVVQ